jgi:tetratricopeptide (TPR) repeat protein
MTSAVFLLFLLAPASELADYNRLDQAQRQAPRDPAAAKAWLDASERLATRAAGEIEAGHYAEARILLRATQRALHGVASWNNLLGYAEFKLSNPKPALQYLQRALHMEPDNEDFLLDLGEFLGAYRAYDEAVRVFQVAAKRNPGSPRVRFGLAVAYLMQNRRDLAQTILEDLSSAYPRLEPVYKALGECYEDAGNGQAMIALGRKLQQINPGNALGWYLEGAGLLRGARVEGAGQDQAIAALRKSVGLDPSNSRARFQLARALDDAGQTGQAIEELKETVRLDPKHERAHYVLGRLYQKEGNTGLARQEMEIHRGLKENDKQAQYQRLLITVRDSAAGGR